MWRSDSDDFDGFDVLIGGGCMSPSFSVGDVIRVEKKAVPLRRGDVVLIEGRGQRSAHRVALTWSFLGRRRVAHRGDHPGARVAVAAPEHVVGRVQAVRRYGELQWTPVEHHSTRPLWSDVLATLLHYGSSLRQRR